MVEYSKFLKEDGEYITIFESKLDKVLYEIELLKSEVDYLNRATVGEGCVCNEEY